MILERPLAGSGGCQPHRRLARRGRYHELRNFPADQAIRQQARTARVPQAGTPAWRGAAMDDEAVTAWGTGREDPVILGSGIPGHTSPEGHADRHGAVHLTVLDSIPGELAPARTVPVAPDDDRAARILQGLAETNPDYAAAAAASETAARRPDNRVVAFDHAWHTDTDLLHGCIDVDEVTGRFAAAYLMRRRGPERRLTDPKEVGQNLASSSGKFRAEGTA